MEPGHFSKESVTNEQMRVKPLSSRHAGRSEFKQGLTQVEGWTAAQSLAALDTGLETQPPTSNTINPGVTSKTKGRQGDQLGHIDSPTWPWILVALGIAAIVEYVRRAVNNARQTKRLSGNQPAVNEPFPSESLPAKVTPVPDARTARAWSQALGEKPDVAAFLGAPRGHLAAVSEARQRAWAALLGQN